ncbi:hypothetical protein D3C76_1776600 [compost metagenome]
MSPPRQVPFGSFVPLQQLRTEILFVLRILCNLRALLTYLVFYVFLHDGLLLCQSFHYGKGGSELPLVRNAKMDGVLRGG